MLDGRVIGEAPAELPRPDLVSAGLGDGRCGFQIALYDAADAALLPFVAVRLFAAGEAEEEETSGMRELVLLLRETFGERLFSAADLAALLQAPAVAAAAAPQYGGPRDEFEQRAAEAAERAQALRAALEGATGKALPPGAAATARLVGKRLQMVVGRPVALGGGGEVGAVAKAHAGHEANAYRVTATPAGGP
jgi:hypothetical protein